MQISAPKTGTTSNPWALRDGSPGAKVTLDAGEAPPSAGQPLCWRSDDGLVHNAAVKFVRWGPGADRDCPGHLCVLVQFTDLPRVVTDAAQARIAVEPPPNEVLPSAHLHALEARCAALEARCAVLEARAPKLS